MITLAKLKRDLEISRGLGDIIDVLKTAAILQFHAIQLKEKPDEEFLKAAESSLKMMLAKYPDNPYFAGRKKYPTAIVLVTSDEGFLGELNTVLINKALAEKKTPDDTIIVLGERGVRYLQDLEMRFVSFPGIPDEISFKDVEKVRNYLSKEYRSRFGRILAVYPRFVSLTYQKMEVAEILPYSVSDTKSKKADIFPEEETEIEPSPRRVIEMLIDLWMGFKFLDIFWSSKQSEYAARIMHLEGSTRELADLNHNLSLAYFRQVHALRDMSIREISASKILLEKGHS